MNSDAFGPTITQLWDTIESRRSDAATLDGHDTRESGSYTVALLTGPGDTLYKKLAEESTEAVMAAKDLDAARARGTDGTSPYGTSRDHLIYELGDVLYHFLVVCARFDITPNDLADALQRRFKN